MSIALLRLPRMQRYALASILALAETPRERRPTSDELAERTGAPRPMLTKVLRRLVVAGLIEGERGHHGGYRLVRSAEDIVLCDIFNAVTEDEVTQGERECALVAGICDPSHPCKIHNRWVKATDPFAEMISSVTIADVLRGDIAS